MKNRRILAILFVILLLVVSTQGIAAPVYYSAITLPKVTSAITPNISLQTTGKKTDAVHAARHRFSTISGSSNTQAVRMWRDDNKSVTSTLFHAEARTYSMGVGSTRLIPKHTYYVKARGNTLNSGAVVVYGWVDAEGGSQI